MNRVQVLRQLWNLWSLELALTGFCCQDGIGSWWKEGQLVVLHTPQQRCDDHLGAIHFQKIEAELKPKPIIQRMHLLQKKHKLYSWSLCCR